MKFFLVKYFSVNKFSVKTSMYFVMADVERISFSNLIEFSFEKLLFGFGIQGLS